MSKSLYWSVRARALADVAARVFVGLVLLGLSGYRVGGDHK